MTKGLKAPLSPREEITLRRVALGIAAPHELPRREIMRLVSLDLVSEVEGVARLTSIGRQRYEGLARPDPGHPLLRVLRDD